MIQLLDALFSHSKLFILSLDAGSARLYFAQGSKAKALHEFTNLESPEELFKFASENTQYPWALVVDRAEESFVSGVMPTLSGTAKNLWMKRFMDQSDVQSQYRWNQNQGTSTSQSDKQQFLSYALTQAEDITKWLTMLLEANVRIKGVYSPTILVPAVCRSAKIKLPLAAKASARRSSGTPIATQALCVLVTPHPNGLRQTVLVNGFVRISRLVVVSGLLQHDWSSKVRDETQRLREYLISSGLLGNHKSTLLIYCLLPTSVRHDVDQVKFLSNQFDRYEWIQHAWTNTPFIHVLAKQQPFKQLAPVEYIYSETAHNFAHRLKLVCVCLALVILGYAGLRSVDLWATSEKISDYKQITLKTRLAYQEIVKSYPPSPLTARQLEEMNTFWQRFKLEQTPAMRPMLSAAGQVLAKNPNVELKELVWQLEDAKLKQAGTPQSRLLPSSLSPPGQTQTLAPASEGVLLLRSTLLASAQNDLRGIRDTLTQILADFNANPKLRAEFTKRPIDLSAKGQISGGGQREPAEEREFEIKLWSR